MTSPQAGGADRFSRAAERPLRASAATPALVILLLLGLVLRLTIAYVLWPASGFESDIASYTAWAHRLYELGPGRFYEPGVFADYPPAYLYLLWIGSHVTAFVHGGNLAAVSSDVLKLGPILADIGVAAALYAICRRWARERPDAQRLGLIAAGLYLFNPVTWYDSALWGQTDSVGALVILLCVAALIRGNSEGAAVLAVLAALVKPQFGIVVAPIVAAVLLRRHLFAPGSGPRNRPWAPSAGVRDWLSREQGLIRLVSSAAIGLATLLLLITPFNLSVIDFIGRMAGTAGGYPWLSVNAYNPWALLGSAGEQPLILGFRWSSDTVPFLGPLPAVAIGAALLVGGFLLGMLRVGWRDDRRSILLVAIFLALAFFVLPTRVHERYLFPVFALLPLLAVLDRRWLLALIGLSVGALINFHGILTTPLYATPNIENLPLGDFFRQPLPILLSVVLVSAAFLFVLFQLRPASAREPDPYEALDETTWPEDEGYEPSPPIRRRAGIFGPIRETLAPLVAVVPIRRDRSSSLASERGGRLDRLDLLLLVIVLLATLGLRTFRLEKPYGMHFDEVYHARTATEFLQHWRYGMPHPIYENTHPHLAKYVMALGIIALGNNRVVTEGQLGGPVEGAATERRWSPDDNPGRRNGDRLYLATGSDVRVLDLADRLEEATVPVAADLVAVDDDGHVLFMADSAGGLWRLPTDQLDTLRFDRSAPVALTPEPLPTLDGLAGELTWLGLGGNRLIAIDSGGTILSVDAETGEPLGRADVAGAAEAQPVSAGERVMVDVAVVTEPSELADRLAEILDQDPAELASRITARESGRVALGAYIEDEQSAEIQTAIDADELPGVTIESGSAVAVAGIDGVTILDAETLDQLAFLSTDAPVTGLALVERGVDQPTIYAAAGSVLQTIRLPDDGAPELGQEVVMPNEVRDAVWNRTTALLHVLGTRQDGSGSTIYVVAPVANSIFADAPLAFEPSELLLDAQPQRPADDRADLLALAPSGTMATVDAGSNAFAWRFPGVVAGALMAACLYLLARFLFSRRSIAVIAALLVLADGMFFANARIAMNDTYVGLFIVAAFTLFVPLWLGRWRSRWSTPAVLLGVGVLLGLALASKWVGAYAIGAIGLLILVRSALGRLVALAAMVGLTGLLGYLAMTPAPEVTSPQLNSLFLLLMVGLTVALAVMIALRPIRLTTDELRLAVIGPLAGGGLLLLAGAALVMLNPGAPMAGDGLITPTWLLLAGAALAGIGAMVYVAARAGGRLGWGPLARPAAAAVGAEPAAPPPPTGWLRPGSGLLGLPWLLGLALITLIPLGVYALSFAPWIELGNRWTSNFPAGNGGQLFLDLQVSMYEYHNNLRATHAASSPWWAWPLDLKPVWFYREEFAHNTTAQIYDAGNLPLFWLSLPAMAFAAYQAWRRRSLALTVIVVAVACLWLPWARIDRVAFQYHIFTSLPFWVLGLAYFLAELWHGPSARTWLLARVAAALAIIGPAVLWLLRVPLCGLARTEQVNAGTEVCGALSRNLVLTDIQVVGLLAAFSALLLIGWLLWQGRRETGASTARSSLVLSLVFGLVLVGGALALLGAALPGRQIFEHSVRAEEPALVMLFLLVLPAYLVLRARDARRFVVGALAAIGVWFVVWYPNIAALPVPRTLSEIYQGLLPTWNYAFQFGSNQDAANRSPMDLTSIGLLTLLTAVIAVGAIYAARAWRADRAADEGALSVLRDPG